MSPAERMQALVQGRTPDRAPFSPFGIGFAARLAGIDRGEFYRSPETAFRCGLEVAKTYTWMNSRPTYGWADRGIWEFGGRIVWPDGNRYAAPLGEAPLISSPEQVDDLPDPDPATAGMNPLLDRFNRLARDNGFPASLPGGTPTAMASAIAGRQNFLRWMIRSPEAVHRLQAKVTSFIMRTAQRTMDRFGPENCGGMVAVPLESNQIMSEKMFARFCKPYIAQILDFYVSSGVKSLMVHLCGDHTFNLPHWKDLPLPPRTVYSVGHEMDLEETGRSIGPGNILAGNLNNSVLLIGTVEEVKSEVRRCLEAGMHREGGFVLMPACELPPDTPLENIDAIALALAEYGFYR